MALQKTFMWLAFASLVCILPAVVMAQTKSKTSRTPPVRNITSIDQLMPFARWYINTPNRGMISLMKPSLGAKKGDKILLITEITVDPLLIAAIRDAALEAGCEFNVIEFHGFPTLTDPVESQLKYTNRRPDQAWPDWLWKAMESVNIVTFGYGIEVHNITQGIRKWYADRKIKMVRFPFFTAEMLALSGLTYPDELLEAINTKVWKQIYGAKEIRITDPLGTDLTIRLDPGYWDRLRKAYDEFVKDESDVIWPGHIMVVPFFSREKAFGKLVADTLHGGPIPQTSIEIRDGHWVEVAGSGTYAEYLRRVKQQYAGLTLPGASEPGADFLMEVSVGTQPKASRSSSVGLAGEARFRSFAEGRKRAGVLHISLGTPTAQFVEDQETSNKLLDFLKEHDLTLQHMDTELYHATYIADGKQIVENGRLLVLDDPEIRRIASKYGNADELLSEDWIPPLHSADEPH